MKTLETIPEPEPGQGIMQTYIEGQDTPFYVHGDAEVIQGLYEASKARQPAEVHNVPVKPLKPAVEPESSPRDVLPTYQPMTAKTRIKDWLSDAQWRKVDRELGLAGTDLSIVRERQERRLATRILVARIAAGVEKPPVWGKHKAALKLAERALQEA